MNLKSRKLLCAGICFISASGALIAGLADFQGWADFIKWVFGIYAAGNVGEHVAVKKEKNENDI
jgi:hypothetical protein